jgi:hypothetical protein
MPTFLTTKQLYKLVNAELPEFVYAYAASPTSFYVSSEFYSYAECIHSLYETMQNIYIESIPNTCTLDGIAGHEIAYLGQISMGNLSLEERRSIVLSKIRSLASCSMWNVLQFITTFYPDVYFQIVTYNTQYSGDGWVVDESLLGFNTFLSAGSLQTLTGSRADEVWTGTWEQGDPMPNGVNGDPDITQAEVLAMRETAYGFLIRVFGTDFTTLGNFTEFERQFAQIIPVRSDYHTLENAVLTDYDLTEDVTDLTEWDNINCMMYESSTGLFLGKRKPIV